MYKVDLQGLILKTGMALAGKENLNQSTPEEVGKATVQALLDTVPENVPGVVFLSGGQESEQAIKNLSAISKFKNTPWPTTFSYLRAIQGPSLELWRGDDTKIPEARTLFLKNLEACSKASLGQY
jgi:fructose-bisphosphate aldolase class I